VTTPDPKTVEALDRLEALMPDMMKQYTEDGDLLEAFAGEADCIEHAASDADHDYVRGRLDCMLKNAHLIPGEDEGEPCA
jgi:hypothetical protein